MLFRTEPRHACETPLIQGSPPGHAWACSCGQSWTVRHRVSEYGGHLTWTRDPARRRPGKRWNPAAIFGQRTVQDAA